LGTLFTVPFSKARALSELEDLAFGFVKRDDGKGNLFLLDLAMAECNDDDGALKLSALLDGDCLLFVGLG